MISDVSDDFVPALHGSVGDGFTDLGWLTELADHSADHRNADQHLNMND